MTDTRKNPTYREPMPLHSQRATYDGFRSVRLLNDDIGLATTAYSYKLGYDEVQEAAERIALMWNLHLGESVEELRARYLDAPSPSPIMAPADYQEKLSDFLEALDEWGCEDNNERAEQIIEFQRKGYDLDAYLVEHPDRPKSEVN